MAEDEMVRWHHRLSGHEFERTPGDREGQRSLACLSRLAQPLVASLTPVCYTPALVLCLSPPLTPLTLFLCTYF